MRWDTMRGDERERYCSKCSRTVVNISLLTTAEREALLANPPPGGLCVAYYQRLSGEHVSAETPLTPAESRRVVQWGVIAASAASLAAAVHFAPEISAGAVDAAGPVVRACDDLKAKGQEVLYDLGLMKRPPVRFLMGAICLPPTPAPSGVTPSPTPAVAPGGNASAAPEPAPTSLPAENKT